MLAAFCQKLHDQHQFEPDEISEIVWPRPTDANANDPRCPNNCIMSEVGFQSLPAFGFRPAPFAGSGISGPNGVTAPATNLSLTDQLLLRANTQRFTLLGDWHQNSSLTAKAPGNIPGLH